MEQIERQTFTETLNKQIQSTIIHICAQITHEMIDFEFI